MRLLIDGNILLDVLQKREPHYEDSAMVWKMCETDMVDGHISALTFANLVYVMRKELDAEKVNEVLEKMSLIFSFEDLTVSDMNKAAEMRWADFEDAVHAATAKRIHADYIITRNVKDFKNSEVIAFTPSEFLARQ